MFVWHDTKNKQNLHFKNNNTSKLSSVRDTWKHLSQTTTAVCVSFCNVSSAELRTSSDFKQAGLESISKGSNYTGMNGWYLRYFWTRHARKKVSGGNKEVVGWRGGLLHNLRYHMSEKGKAGADIVHYSVVCIYTNMGSVPGGIHPTRMLYQPETDPLSICHNWELKGQKDVTSS